MNKTKRRTSIWVSTLLTILLLVSEASAQAPAQDSSYRIGPNDILSIFVWREPDLTRDVTVMPDGKITYPLIGEIMAQGLTAIELKKAITDKFQDFVTAPEVTVIVKESRSQVVYAIGKLTRPGPIALAPGIGIPHRPTLVDQDRGSYELQ